MTCKDCVHYEVCAYDNTISETKCCAFFKPKSRFVELPCEVGRGIYIVKDNEIYPAKVQKIKLYTDTMTISGICWNEKEERWGDFLTPLCCFGKTVFLTKEEAEKALKEREK